MIIIDERAEERLLHHLQRLGPNPEGWRCLYIKTVRDDVLTKLDEAIPAKEKFVYLLSGVEAFILAPNMSVRDIRRASQLVAADIFSVHSDLYELDGGWHRLIYLVEIRHNKVEKEAAAKRLLVEEKKREEERLALINIPISSTLTESLPARRRAHSKTEIMLVEDDPFSRRLVENILKESFNVTYAATGREAILAFAHKAPHILFLDINLPDLSGHDVLRRVLAIDKSAYVVMLSGQGDRANVLRAVQAGAAGFIAKPFTRDKLMQYVERCPLLPVSTGGGL
jgi:two-component system chemotaxis response regulator CheY